MKTTISLLSLLGLAVLFFFAGANRPARAQGQPTPPVIDLTPTPSPAGPGDRFEPNDDPAAAAAPGWGTHAGLTLPDGDVDYYSGFLKAGQILHIATAVDAQLDTALTLFWDGRPAAENDDRGAADLGSEIFFRAPADGPFTARVVGVHGTRGGYTLALALAAPTATPTAPATATPTVTPTTTPTATPPVPPDPAEPNDTPDQAAPIVPGARRTLTVAPGDVDYFLFLGKAGTTYACETVTPRVDTLLEVSGAAGLLAANDDRGPGRIDSRVVFTTAVEQTVFVRVTARGGSSGPYELLCDFAAAAPPAGGSGSGAGAASGPAASPAPVISATAIVTASGAPRLTARPLGTVTPPPEPATPIRLLIYYDANNDRQPSPGEGVPNVSVVAVDATGQPLARVFTNANGEARFNVTGDAARVVVPFVSGWSTALRAGAAGEEIVLGLPAVLIPRFFPIAVPAASEGGA